MSALGFTNVAGIPVSSKSSFAWLRSPRSRFIGAVSALGKHKPTGHYHLDKTEDVFGQLAPVVPENGVIGNLRKLLMHSTMRIEPARKKRKSSSYRSQRGEAVFRDE